MPKEPKEPISLNINFAGLTPVLDHFERYATALHECAQQNARLTEERDKALQELTTLRNAPMSPEREALWSKRLQDMHDRLTRRSETLHQTILERGSLSREVGLLKASLETTRNERNAERDKVAALTKERDASLRAAFAGMDYNQGLQAQIAILEKEVTAQADLKIRYLRELNALRETSATLNLQQQERINTQDRRTLDIMGKQSRELNIFRDYFTAQGRYHPVLRERLAEAGFGPS